MEYIVMTSLWVLYCLQQGWNDARHFANGTAHHIKTNSSYNIHTSLLLGRIIVFSLIVFISFKLGGNLVEIFTLGAGLLCLFPFLHEGMYYSSRKKIDSPIEYPDSHLALWFGYSSSSSTAKINFLGLGHLLPVRTPKKQDGKFIEKVINFIQRVIIYPIKVLIRFILSRPTLFIIGVFILLTLVK